MRSEDCDFVLYLKSAIATYYTQHRRGEGGAEKTPVCWYAMCVTDLLTVSLCGNDMRSNGYVFALLKAQILPYLFHTCTHVYSIGSSTNTCYS